MARTLQVSEDSDVPSPRVLSVSDAPRVLDVSTATSPRELSVSSDQPRVLSVSSPQDKPSLFDSPASLYKGVVGGALKFVGKVLDPLNIPSRGLGSLLTLAKTGDIQQANQSLQDKRGLGSVIVGKDFEKDHPIATLGANVLADPTTYLAGKGIGDFFRKLSPLAGPVAETASQAPEVAQAVAPTIARAVAPIEQLQVDISRTAGKIQEAFGQVRNVLETGTFQPQEVRPLLAKGEEAAKQSVVSKDIVQKVQQEYVAAGKQFDSLRQQAEKYADDFTKEQLRVAEERFRNAFGQRQEAARVAHESLYEFQNRVKEVESSAQMLGLINDVKTQIPNLDKLVLGGLRKVNPEWADWYASKVGVDKIPENLKIPDAAINYLRTNLFTLGSWTLDAFTNTLATAHKMPGYLLEDVYNMSKGNPPARTLGLIGAIQKTADMKVEDLVKKGADATLGMPEDITRALGGAVGGEVGVGSATNLKAGKFPLDYVVAPAVKLKGQADSIFSRTMAYAELVSEGVKRAAKAGLQGGEKDAFIQNFVKNPGDFADEAIRVGREVRFDVPLTKLEEDISKSKGVKLLAEAFPRWTFQYGRWLGRSLGANPRVWNEMKAGTLTGEGLVRYMADTATGWGGVELFNNTIYPHIDYNSMEYVKDNGDRVRLSGRSPAPELAFLVALLHGDIDKSRKALEYASLPGAKVLSGQPGGLIENWLKSMSQVGSGEITNDRFTQEWDNMVNHAIPGQAMLSLLKTLDDPVLRRGIGAEIPFISRLLPPQINAATGEPLKPRQELFGAQFPAIGGVAIPGATRVLEPVEKELLKYGVGLFRPRRTPIAEFESRDIPPELRQEFEQKAGRYVKQFVSEKMADPAYQDATDTQKETVLKALKGRAESVAKAEIAREHDIVLRGVEPPLRTKLLPEQYLQDSGIKKGNGIFERRKK